MQCTFYGNRTRYGVNGGGICLTCGGTCSLNNTLIAFSSSGGAIGCGAVHPTVICCDLFGNVGGDWEDCVADQYGINGNICTDPLFCDPENGDFALDCTSPCAAENNPECGQIGAWPVGCGATPAVETTWGALKKLFGRYNFGSERFEQRPREPHFSP